MDDASIDQHIMALQKFIEDIQQRMDHDSTKTAPRPTEMLEALRQTLEELRIANHELIQQSEELGVARLTIEQEHLKYQELFDCAPDGYLVTDSDGAVREANHAVADLFNISLTDLLSKPLIDFVVESDRPAFRERLNSLSQAQRIADWQVSIQPRERPAFPAAITVLRATEHTGRATLAHSRCDRTGPGD